MCDILHDWHSLTLLLFCIYFAIYIGCPTRIHQSVQIPLEFDDQELWNFFSRGIQIPNLVIRKFAIDFSRGANDRRYRYLHRYNMLCCTIALIYISRSKAIEKDLETYTANNLKFSFLVNLCYVFMFCTKRFSILYFFFQYPKNFLLYLFFIICMMSEFYSLCVYFRSVIRNIIFYVVFPFSSFLLYS